MARQGGEIIDGDGHIFERDDDLRPYLEGKYPHQNLMNYAFFPSLDRWRRTGAGGGEPSTPEMWLRFLDRAEISATVLYPTAGLPMTRGWARVYDPQIHLWRTLGELLDARLSSAYLCVTGIPCEEG